MTDKERKARLRAQEALYREKNRARIRAYDRAYRQRKRAEALLKKQSTWTREEWEAWETAKRAKECAHGTPAGLVNDVVAFLAAEQNLAPDVVLERLLEGGGVEFLIKGAESLGKARASRKPMIEAAARAVNLWLDFDHGILCRARRKKEA